jgi:hypothetical protein
MSMKSIVERYPTKFENEAQELAFLRDKIGALVTYALQVANLRDPGLIELMAELAVREDQLEARVSRG